MTENNRFINPTYERVIKDRVTGKEATYYDTEDGLQFRKWLNDLNDENEELKYTLCAYMVDLNNYKGKCSALEIENKELKQFQKKVFELIGDNIGIYEDTTTNDEHLQIQLDTKLQTLYNLQKELMKCLKKDLK